MGENSGSIPELLEKKLHSFVRHAYLLDSAFLNRNFANEVTNNQLIFHTLL